MRWKRLLRVGLVSVALVVPAATAIAATAAARPSPSPVEMVEWLETAWRRLVLFAANEASLDPSAAEDGGPEWDPDGPAASERDGDDAPAAEGGPEWDPDGSS